MIFNLNNIIHKQDNTIYINKSELNSIHNELSDFSRSNKIIFLEQSEFFKLNSSFNHLNEKENIEELLNFSHSIDDTTEESVLIKFVNNIFIEAIKLEASDIHIESLENSGLVKFRVNGILTKEIELSSPTLKNTINRIKVISNLDISQTNFPQDGQSQVVLQGLKYDLRISIIPNFFGERVVIRLLLNSNKIPLIQDIGFNSDTLSKIKKQLNKDRGFILISGSTGSGKSTTLHSFLNYINSPGKNIITIEDPVEYKNEKLNQIQINPEINFTFYEALKRVLRQDPDIIMLGEIRDQKSAEIAIKSSLTGHLVLSTLHTNSAKESINRLLDLNVKPFLISSSLLCIISQKLVKILCEKCKVQLPTGDFKSKGCSNCNQTGFSSRKLVYEYFEPTELELEELLNNKTANIKESNELVKSLEKLVNSGYIENNNLNI
mgnify:CR=1 FL=1